MVLRREAIEERLKELDRILQELSKHKDLSREAFDSDLSQQWIIERGLIAAASVILDVADHILAGHFGYYAETYEDSLRALRDRGVISATLYRQIKGLGGFRNILVHRYLDIDPDEVVRNLKKGLTAFPRFATQVLSWLDAARIT